MATSASSSLLPLFIDTDLDTHFSFAIDGHQTVAQLKEKIVSEHASCFPRFGEISVTAVKVNIGEVFYHLTDSMTLNCFFQSVEGIKRFQVDIVLASSTSKSSDQIKTHADACMHDGQLENNCRSSNGALTIFDAKTKEKVQLNASLKYSRYFKPRSIKEKKVSGNENNASIDDSLPEINGTLSENPPEEILLKETISICNSKCSDSYILKAPVQPDTNTSTKDLSDLKHKRKRIKKVPTEPSRNSIVEDSSHKAIDNRANNQGIVKEATSICKDFGSEAGVAASTKESSLPSTVQHVESSLQANVDDKHCNSNASGSGSNRRNHEKINSGSRTKHDSIVDLDNTKTSPVGHGDNSMDKTSDTSQKVQIKMDSDARMEKKVAETDEVENSNCIAGAPVHLNTNTSVKDSTDPKHKRKKERLRNIVLSGNPPVEVLLHKINDTRADNQSIVEEAIGVCNDFGNESGLAASIKESSPPSTVQHIESSPQANDDDMHCNRNGNGSGSNRCNPEKADFGSGTKDDSFVSLDNAKALPVGHGDNSIDKISDTSQKVQIKMDSDARMEKKVAEADEVENPNCIHGAPVHLDTNTSVKDSTDPKHKRKKERSRNKELSGNLPVEVLLHKINDTRADNQSIVEEAIGICNDFGNESGLAASIKESSLPSTVQHIESSPQDVDDMRCNCNGNGSGSNRCNPEKANFGSGTKDDSFVSLGNAKALPVEHGDSLMSKAGDTSQKIHVKVNIDARMEKKPLETNEDVNHNRHPIHGAPVHHVTNTVVKDSTDPKHKRKKKKPRNQEPYANPLLEDSLHKINRSENQPKEGTVKETISKSNDFGDESGRFASFKESPQPITLQHGELSQQANVDGKIEGKGEVIKVSSPGKLLNSTSCDTTVKDSTVLKHKRKKKSSNKEPYANPLLEDSLHKINRSENQPKEGSVKKTISKSNDFGDECGISASLPITLQPGELLLQANVNDKHEGKGEVIKVSSPGKTLNSTSRDTTVKDSTDPKHKRKKKSRSNEPYANPPVEDSLPKINLSENQPKVGSVKETISKSNDFGDESGISASFKENSQPITLQHGEILVQANVVGKHEGKGEVIKVSSPDKQLNSTSRGLDSAMYETDASSTDIVDCHKTATNKVLKHEHISENVTGNEASTQFSNDPASQIPNERSMPGLAISGKETISEATGKHGVGNIATLDNSIKQIAQTQKRRHKCVVRKIRSSKCGDQSMKSNENELAMQRKKNDGSRSNMHETEKGKSSNRAKDDANASLGDTKISPEKTKRKLIFGSPLGVTKAHLHLDSEIKD